MSASTIWNAEWPNCNSQRNYPLKGSATDKDITGSISLPENFIVDFTLSVPASTGLNPALFHVAQVGVFSSGVVLSFGYDGTAFATINIPTSSFTKYSTYRISGRAAFSTAVGWVTIGELDDVLALGGAWDFDTTGAGLLPSLIRPSLQAVSSIAIANGSDVSEAITGDIVLQAGANVGFRLDESGDTPIIYIDAANGLNLEEECACTDLDNSAPCIRTINGIAPNEAGNLTFIGSDCMSLTPGEATITLTDTCSTPCCDCRELEVVTETAATLQSQILGLEVAAERLGAAMDAMQINLSWPR